MNTIKTLSIILTCLLIGIATAQANTIPPTQPAAPITPVDTSIQQGLDQIINSFNHDVSVGVIVQSTSTGATLYQHDANRMFMPASTMKLFTATAALAYLGPNYVFSTQMFGNTIPINSILPGNLYVKFSGDPMLTIDDLNNMIAILSQRGVRIIQGSLVIDDTALDQVNWAPGWMWDEQILCYAAPATSIILNRNCFGVSLAAGTQANTPGHISIEGTLANISILNRVTTRQADYWQCPLDLVASGNNTYVLSGCLAPKHAPMGLSIALNDTRKAGTDILLHLLNQHGITLAGGVRYGQTPASAKLLAEHNSAPLSALITRMLKKSDNLIADTLFKKLGGTYFNTTGTWNNGSQAVRAILSPRTGINFHNMVMVDGAGLSRYDLVNPTQFATLLNYAYRSLPANNVFYQALPSSGIDGTLRYRLGGPVQGKVHAKTGTMVSTSGLAGYIETANHQTLTFAILINGFVGKQAPYHLLEDKICQFLAEKG